MTTSGTPSSPKGDADPGQAPDPVQVPSPRSVVRHIGLLTVACVLLGGSLLWPDGRHGLSAAGAAALGVVLFSVILWIGRVLPLTVTALLSMGLLIVTGVVPDFASAAAGFAMDTVFFVLAVNLVSRAVMNAGLLDRIARAVLGLTGGRPRNTLWVITAVNQLTSFIMPSALVRTKTYLPVVRTIGRRLGLDPDGERAFLTTAGLIFSLLGPVATIGLLTGGAVSIVSARTIAEFHSPVTWLQWLILMLPPSALITVSMSWYMQRVFMKGQADPTNTIPSAEPANRANPRNPTDAIDAPAPARDISEPTSTAAPDPTAENPPWSANERFVLFVLLLTLGLWLSAGHLGIPLALPAMLAAALLSLPGTHLIRGEDVQSQGWDEFMVVGGALSLSRALSATGAIEWLAMKAFSILPAGAGAMPLYLLVMAFAAFVRQFFLMPSPAVAVTLPITMELGRLTGTDPMFIALINAGVIASVSIVPVQSPAGLVVYTEGVVTTPDQARVAPFLFAFVFSSFLLAATVYWPLLRLLGWV